MRSEYGRWMKAVCEEHSGPLREDRNTRRPDPRGGSAFAGNEYHAASPPRVFLAFEGQKWRFCRVANYIHCKGFN